MGKNVVVYFFIVFSFFILLIKLLLKIEFFDKLFENGGKINVNRFLDLVLGDLMLFVEFFCLFSGIRKYLG